MPHERKEHDSQNRPKMTKEEFLAYLEGFFTWTYSGPRPKASWLISLEEWVKGQYNKAIKE